MSSVPRGAPSGASAGSARLAFASPPSAAAAGIRRPPCDKRGPLSVSFGRGDGTFEAPQRQPIEGVATAAAVVDLDGDGVLDLLAPEVLFGRMLSLKQPPSVAWPQVLTRTEQDPVALPPGRTELAVSQLRQDVTSLAVRLRLRGPGTDRLRVSLVAPDGSRL